MRKLKRPRQAVNEASSLYSQELGSQLPLVCLLLEEREDCGLMILSRAPNTTTTN